MTWMYWPLAGCEVDATSVIVNVPESTVIVLPLVKSVTVAVYVDDCGFTTSGCAAISCLLLFVPTKNDDAGIAPPSICTTVAAFEPEVVTSPDSSAAVGGEPPRTMPVKAPDEAHAAAPEKYGMPPLVPATVKAGVVVGVATEISPPVKPVLVTVPATAPVTLAK